MVVAPDSRPQTTHYYPLSTEKEDELRKLYRSLDTDKDGQISFTELSAAINQRALRSKNTTLANHHATEIMSRADTSLSGSIDFREFVHYVLEHEKDLTLVFKDIDRNSDGLIDRREVRTYFKTLGVDISESEAMQMVKNMGNDGHLKVDLNEFLRSLRFQPFSTGSEITKYWRHSLIFDIGEDSVVPEDFSEEQIQRGVWLYHLIAGGVAGGISRTSTAPFDRLKVFLQVYGQSKNLGFLSGFQYLYREGGVKSFWRGNGINVIKIAPESALKFTSYEQVKRKLRELRGVPLDGELSIGERFVAGGSAGIISQTAIYPMEVLKTRLALRKTGQLNRGLWKAAVAIYKHDGIPAFFRGYLPNTIGVIPYAGIDLAIYETLKRAYLKRHSKPGEEPSTVTVLLCGATSSTCGQLVSYPLALIRTRLQAFRKSEPQPNTMRGHFLQILETDGFFGLYRGMTPNLMKVLPAVSISYLVYENVRQRLGAGMS